MAAVDPGAIYNQTLADLGQQAAWEEGKITEQLGFLQSNVGYAEGQVTKAEPKAFRGEEKAAARGGLFSSGIEARRRGELVSDFAAKRTANAKRLLEGEAGFKREREGVGLKKTTGEHGAILRRTEQENALQAANPTVLTAGQSAAAGVLPTAGTKPLQFGFKEAEERERKGQLKGPSRKTRM